MHTRYYLYSIARTSIVDVETTVLIFMFLIMRTYVVAEYLHDFYFRF